MSDAGTDAAAASAGIPFTEREMQMLAWAMQSLKSGPPEIDYEKLARFAGMSNPRSASNAWAKIKVKLNFATAEGATPVTPKKVGGKKKAATKGDGDEDDGVESTVKKTPRKRTPKTQEVDGESPSPKKRGRPAKAKKPAEAIVETKIDVKTEADAEESSVENSGNKLGDEDAILEDI